MDHLDRLEHAVRNPLPTLRCCVPRHVDVLVARREQGIDLSFMSLFNHHTRSPFDYFDYQRAAVPSMNPAVKFRVRGWDLLYRDKPVLFRVPESSHLYGTLGHDSVTLKQIDDMDLAVIYTANPDYPFILCREFLLTENNDAKSYFEALADA